MLTTSHIVTIHAAPDWVTSDNHFGHQNIIGFCNRPWATADEMDRGMVERWNSTVGDDDVVLILGDLAMGDITNSLRHVSTLKGHKFLVPGNHDRCHPMYRDADKWAMRYSKEAGVIVLPPWVRILLKDKPVLANHFPPVEHDPYPRDKHGAWRPNARDVKGQQFLCGHVHDAWLQNKDGHVNVGVDVWEYAPAPATALADLLDGKFQSA